MKLKAIETHYGSYYFRSRLEARWAVFFDTLKIEWEYEKEGYDLGAAGWYLPDFWLPQVNMWAEVKPIPLTEEEIKKCDALSEITGYSCLRLVGIPDNKVYYISGVGNDVTTTEYGEDNGFILTNVLLHENRLWYVEPADDDENFASEDSYLFKCTKDAVIAARSARFEHGK